MISDRLTKALEEAERRVALQPVMCNGDPDHMSPETIEYIVKRERDNMIIAEITKILRGLP